MADYYTCDKYAEGMSAQTPDEAIEEYLVDARYHPLPDTLTALAYITDAIGDSPEELADDAIERIYEILDEEYGDPNGDSTDPTPEVTEAAREFARRVIASYKVWRCDRSPAEDVVVDVAAWLQEHKPEWLNSEGSGK